jgi:hypothetical protein
MSDSLIIANCIELLQGDEGGQTSTLPMLGNTIFALNDQQAAYDLGAPQPTVDILASLITDGERPQGRRASNRVLTLPIAIISDTRDNLALARETLMQLVDAQETERFSLTYTRDPAYSNVGPMILDCWRAEPTSIAYSMTEQSQFVCELTLQFEALPYGRSDTPNMITFLTPASGSQAPPAPITLDAFTVIPTGMQGTWVSSTAAVQGGYCAFCPSPPNNPQVTNPLYTNTNIGTNDLTSGLGTPGIVPNGSQAQLNVFQFWAGFASQSYFNNWANHESEVRFITTLIDINGNTVSASRQYRMTESNTFKKPKWRNIQVRIPTTQSSVFDWTQVTGFSIKAQNFGDALLHNSNIFLDTCNMIAPSASAANLTRGSIYRLNGVEGSVHAPASFIIQQQAATSPTTVTLTPSTVTWQDPAGVTSSTIEAVGPGGNGAQVTATAYGGGGGSAEYARENNAQLTPGAVYAPIIPSGLGSQATGAFGSFTQCGAFNSPGPNISNPGASFSTTVAAGNTVIFTVAAPNGSSVATSWVMTDSVNGNYKQLETSTAPDGTQIAVFTFFNSAALSTSNTFTVTGLTCPTSVEIMGMYAAGLFSWQPSQSAAYSGTSNLPSATIPGFLNSNAFAMTNNANWSLSGVGANSVTNNAPPSGCPTTTTLDMGSASNGQYPTLTSKIYTPCVGGVTIVYPKILCYLATQADMHINLGVNWFDATKTAISNNNDQELLTAGSWQYAQGTPHTAPSNAAFFTIDVWINSSTAGNPFHIVALGAVQPQTYFPAQLTVLANGSGYAAGTAANWTHQYGTTSETPLCMDIFYSTGTSLSRGGDICSGAYSASAPWASLTVTFARAGQAIFPADNVSIIANGGVGNIAGATTGGGAGFGSTNSVHNTGAVGANGVASNGGGGASSGGSGGAAAAVDDFNSSVVFSTGHMAPPTLVTSGIPANRSAYVAGNGVYTYGAQVTQVGVSAADTAIVAVVGDFTTQQSVYPQDSHGNTYQFIQKTTLADGRFVQIFYARSGNQPDGSFTPLNNGDFVWVGNNSGPGNYAIFVYCMQNVTGILGNAGSIGNGIAVGTFTSTTGSLTDSGLSGSAAGHVVFALNETNQYASMLPLQNTPADTEDFANVNQYNGTPWTNQGEHLDVFWKDEDSGSSTTFNFSIPTSANVAVIATSWFVSTVPWDAATGAKTSQYTNGTHHFTNQAGRKVVITFTGSQAQVTGVQGPNQGTMLVSVDSGPYQLVDNYATGYLYKSVLFDTGQMNNTSHTITILTTGQGDASSSNSYVDIDGYQIISLGSGVSGSGQSGGAAVTGGGAGGNGGVTNANGSAGGSPGGGGGGGASTSGTKLGGVGGNAQILLTYYNSLPAFKTLVLHRPSLDGSNTLLPYIACSTQAVPTNDLVQPIDSGTVPHFRGTYSMMVNGTFNTPSASRTVTVTVNEYERAGGSVTSISSCSRTITPNTDAVNGLVTIGELTLPNKDIPDENNNAVYYVVVSSTNGSDTVQDVLMLDTMGQTVFINEGTAYSQYFIDEPFPDRDIGRVLGSQFDRPYAISVLDKAFPTGGPISLEPGDNILFAYCVEGAPALVASYFPRYYIDRTVS